MYTSTYMYTSKVFFLQPELTAADIPSPIVNEGFMEEMKKFGISCSDDPHDRMFRAHGKKNYMQVHCIVQGKNKYSILFYAILSYTYVSTCRNTRKNRNFKKQVYEIWGTYIQKLLQCDYQMISNHCLR